MLRDSISGEGGIRTREPFGYPLSKRAHSATMRPLPTRPRSLRSLRLVGSPTINIPSLLAFGDEGPGCPYGFTPRGKAARRSPHSSGQSPDSLTWPFGRLGSRAERAGFEPARLSPITFRE